MARESLDAVLDAVIARVVARVVPVITRSIAKKTAAELQKQLEAKAVKRKTRRVPARARKVITKWVADRRARRVPLFVIEATGLDTKKKIVRRFGPDATFVKGKALPRKAA